MVQGTRCNLVVCIWSNGYKVHNAPSAKAFTQAYAGVYIMIHQELINNTRVTQHINLIHIIMTIRIHCARHDMSVIAAYAPGEHTAVAERKLFWT